MGKKTWISAGAAAVAALAIAFPAHADGRASIHLNIGTAPSYYGYGYPNYPSYGYAQPAYVYTQPSYVYGQPYYGGRGHGYGHGHGNHYRGRRHDMDRDGIPNRWDRDRDGDGVPNRFDHRPRNPYRY